MYQHWHPCAPPPPLQAHSITSELAKHVKVDAPLSQVILEATVSNDSGEDTRHVGNDITKKGRNKICLPLQECLHEKPHWYMQLSFLTLIYWKFTLFWTLTTTKTSTMIMWYQYRLINKLLVFVILFLHKVICMGKEAIYSWRQPNCRYQCRRV